MKNSTLSADEQLIKRARVKAKSENSTLNAQFRIWLAHYSARASEGDERVADYQRLMHELDDVNPGGPYTREQPNER